MLDDLECWRLLWWREVEQFNFELKSSIGRDDTASTSATISVVWWSNNLDLLSLLHLSNTFVPCLDDLTNADLALEGLASLHR